MSAADAMDAMGGEGGMGTPEGDGREAASARRGQGMSQAELEKTLERLDALLASTQDIERLRTGMGIRLALGMAQEMRRGEPLGSRTGDLVAAWTEEHGQDTVEWAVRIAREFLTKPDELRKTLAARLAALGLAPEST